MAINIINANIMLTGEDVKEVSVEPYCDKPMLRLGELGIICTSEYELRSLGYRIEDAISHYDMKKVGVVNGR